MALATVLRDYLKSLIIVSTTAFSVQFRKVFICYKRIGYNLNVMVNPSIIARPVTGAR